MDTIAPEPAIDSLSKTLLKAETSEVSWHADENGGFQLRVGGADCDSARSSTPAPTAPSRRSTSPTSAPPTCSEGANTLRLCLTDAAGNRAQATTSLSKDTTAPETQITTHPATLVNSRHARTSTFSGEDAWRLGHRLLRVPPRLATAAWDACSSGAEYTGLAEGAHKFEVRAIDNAGNTDSSPAAPSWTVDTQAPQTSITEHPPALANVATAKFEFSGDDGSGSGIASFECRRDSGSWDPCSSRIEYTGLADGAHSFEVRAIDNAGNADQSPASSPGRWTRSRPNRRSTRSPRPC